MSIVEGERERLAWEPYTLHIVPDPGYKIDVNNATLTSRKETETGEYRSVTYSIYVYGDGEGPADCDLAQEDGDDVINVKFVPSTKGDDTGFSDVPKQAWYAASVRTVRDSGLMTGNAGKFNPGKNLTRAELASILWRNTFEQSEVEYDAKAKSADGMSDTPNAQWYTDAANWAVHAGVINGSERGSERVFRPNAAVTRQELATILANYVGGAGDPSTDKLDQMPDAGKMSSWARASMAWAVNRGIINGVDKDGVRYLQPTAPVTRAQAAAIIANALNDGVLGVLGSVADKQCSDEWLYQSQFSSTAKMNGTYSMVMTPDRAASTLYRAYFADGEIGSDAVVVEGRFAVGSSASETGLQYVGPQRFVFRVDDDTRFESSGGTVPGSHAVPRSAFASIFASPNGLHLTITVSNGKITRLVLAS